MRSKRSSGIRQAGETRRSRRTASARSEGRSISSLGTGTQSLIGVSTYAGRSVVTWAQRRGNLDFVGERGVSGTLHLRNDTVSINHGG